MSLSPTPTSDYFYSFQINHTDLHWPASLLGMPTCHTVVWDSVQSPFFPQCYLMSGHIILSLDINQERINSYLKTAHTGYSAAVTQSSLSSTSLDLSRIYPDACTHHMVTLSQTICTCSLYHIGQFIG